MKKMVNAKAGLEWYSKCGIKREYHKDWRQFFKSQKVSVKTHKFVSNWGNMKICNNCFKPNDKNAKDCYKCGKRLV